MIALTCQRCGGGFDVEGDPAWTRMAVRYVKFCEPCLAGLEAESEQIRSEQEARLIAARFNTLPSRFKDAEWADEDGRHPEAWNLARTTTTLAPGASPLLLCGPVGTGKSHLAAVVAKDLMHDRDVRWIPVPSTLLKLNAAFSDADRSRAIESIAGTGAAVFDDIDKTGASDWAKAQIFAAIDARVSAGSPLIVTTNFTPDQLTEKLGDAIASRITTGTVCVMAGADRRTEV